MKNLNKISSSILVIIFLIISGCEDINEVEIEIDFVEKYVIQAEIEANQQFDAVYISKTLPLTDKYNIENAEVTNAIVFMVVDSAKIIPLNYSNDARYVPLDNFTAKSGEMYELYALIGETKFYSKTKIPKQPIINFASIESNSYLVTSFNPHEDFVYGATWIISNNDGNSAVLEASDFYSVTNPKDINPEKPIRLRTTSIPEKYLAYNYLDRIYIRVYAFDKDYYSYFNSKNNNTPIENSFTQGGGPINWNVLGENAIGMFIGKSKSIIVKAN